MYIIFGLIILVLPLASIFLFENKLRGILWALFIVISYNLALTLSLMAFSAFSYTALLIGQLALSILVLAFMYKRRSVLLWHIHINPWVVSGFILMILMLCKIHFYYSGIIAASDGPDTVSQNTYIYPYYSDEWVSAKAASYSITSGKLPLVNPLWFDKPLANPLFVFHSAIAEAFLVSQVDPVSGWGYVSTAFGVLLLFSIFLFLKSSGLDDFSSFAATFAVLFVTESSNLPGLWFLNAFLAGFILFILMIASFGLKDTRLALGYLFLSMILYTPIIIFAAPALLGYMIFNKNSSLKSMVITALSGAFAVAITFILMSLHFGFEYIWQLFVSYIVRPNLDGGIPSYGVWNIIPLAVLPFSVAGIWYIWKRKIHYLSLPILVGGIFWICYAYYPNTFVIDYSRTTVITSYLLVMASAFAIQPVLRIVKEKAKEKYVLYALCSFVCITVVFLFVMYPIDTKWTRLVLNHETDNGIIKLQPVPPVTHFLDPDDLKLFRPYKDQIFISPPWKGLVIGSATENYPVYSKPSTISNSILSYYYFAGLTCEDKIADIVKYGISLVYADGTLDCQGLELVGKSREGLYLYEYNVKI